jgi:hypothetical protein
MGLNLKKVESDREARKRDSMVVLTLEDVLTFGKHKGEKVRDVAEYDWGYLIWISENTDKCDIDDDVREKIEEMREEQRNNTEPPF